MHLPTINHGVGWELLETRDGALVCPGLGLSEGHTTWLSRPIIVPKAWSMASSSFSFGIGYEVWSARWGKGCRSCGAYVQNTGSTSSLLGVWPEHDI